jgi:tRNA (cytidine/uridine-2'-O-)-methyltransferase
LSFFSARLLCPAALQQSRIEPSFSFIMATQPSASRACFNIVLLAPEIPQNSGSIGRLCVCVGAALHLIKPLGFSLDEAHLRRAGLDYWPHLQWQLYEDWEDFLLRNQHPTRLFFCSTKCTRSIYEQSFSEGDWLVFGNEGHGLPAEFYQRYREQLYTIPMPGTRARSHNLANAVAITLYEALRQTRWPNKAD